MTIRFSALKWSVRREVWEHRSIYVAPLAVASIVLLVLWGVTFTLPRQMPELSALDPVRRAVKLAFPYNMAGAMIGVTTLLVGLFYCIDALYGERRDRSILFWKSLPVSDLTTVLAKLAIPLLVLPAVAFVLTVVTQMVLLVLSGLVLAVNGDDAMQVWEQVPFVQMALAYAYGLIVFALWHAPIYTWLLLVSCWARRTPLLWAVLPVVAVGIFERLVLRTSLFPWLFRHRMMGALPVAFSVDERRHAPIVWLSQLEPLRFLSHPGLWLGLGVALVFVAAAVRLRRRREPM